jgi:hypothetical protein
VIVSVLIKLLLDSEIVEEVTQTMEEMDQFVMFPGLTHALAHFKEIMVFIRGILVQGDRTWDRRLNMEVNNNLMK